jgi:hypothetical protein
LSTRLPRDRKHAKTNLDKRRSRAFEPIMNDLLPQTGFRCSWRCPASDGELLLIGRRDPRSNNTWMHNEPILVSGHERCVLLVHPIDAERVGVRDGEVAVLESRVHRGFVPVHVTNEMTPWRGEPASRVGTREQRSLAASRGRAPRSFSQRLDRRQRCRGDSRAVDPERSPRAPEGGGMMQVWPFVRTEYRSAASLGEDAILQSPVGRLGVGHSGSFG